MLSDKQIRELILSKGLVEGAALHQVKEHQGKRLISYGVSSYGYDVQLSNVFHIFNNINCTVIDPKAFDRSSFTEVVSDDVITIPPLSFALAHSAEYYRIPRDMIGLVCNKSTYARCAVNAPTTVLEPEWEGHITLEFFNSAPLPSRMYPFEGSVQILFIRGEEVCETSYKDRNGKYQGQTKITLPKV